MPVDDIEIKPIIREIARTHVCFSDIKLLIDRIEIVNVRTSDEADDRQAYRLFLTDREKTIQAVVRRRLHRTLNHGDVREGSFVVLKDYCLARAKRTKLDSEVIYLQIADFYAIGEEAREARVSPSKAPSAVDEKYAHSKALETSSPRTANLSLKRAHDEAPDDSKPHPFKRRREREHLGVEIDAAPGLDLSTDSEGVNDGAQTAEPPDLDSEMDEDKDDSTYDAAHELFIASDVGSTGNTSKPITRPLLISTLASVTGPNRSKNEVHDILALIVHVDAHTFKPPRMPRKRDLRIMDASTSKRVVLSVFTDPVGFAPKSGTVALFRNLTTHDWNGGNLKAYPWLCEDRPWFMPVPDGEALEGVDEEDVQRLRDLRGSLRGSDTFEVETAQ